MEKRLYVGNLPYTTTEEELRTLFGQAGQVTSIAIITDRDTGRSKGFGFVEMATAADAQKALSMFNGYSMGRRQLTVNAEDQYMILTGVIRPEDITSDNLILSQYIADARIVYTGRGVVDDKMRPGWLTRVIDWVWPF